MHHSQQENYESFNVIQSLRLKWQPKYKYLLTSWKPTEIILIQYK